METNESIETRIYSQLAINMATKKDERKSRTHKVKTPNYDNDDAKFTL